MGKIQIVSLCGSMIFLYIVLHQVWRQRLKEAYALLWVLTGILFLVVSIWTNVLKIISDMIGIVYPPATLFLLMLMGILFIIFQYSLVLSKRGEEIKRLTQKTAILEDRIDRLEKTGGSLTTKTTKSG